MRVRNVSYFMNKMNSEKSKNAGPRNTEEIINQQISEFYFTKKNKKKKVA